MKTAIVLSMLLFLVRAAHAETRTVTVELPQSQITTTIPPAKDRAHAPEKIEVLASSWLPRKFSAELLTGRTTTFERAGMPGLSLAYLSSPLVSNHSFSLHFKTGFATYFMKREASVTLSEETKIEEQRLFIVPFRLGLELTGQWLRKFGIYPHVGAALLPSLAILSNSLIATDSTLTGVFYDAAAGVSIALFGVEANVEAVQSFGTVQSVDFSGLGVQAGLRLAI